MTEEILDRLLNGRRRLMKQTTNKKRGRQRQTEKGNFRQFLLSGLLLSLFQGSNIGGVDGYCILLESYMFLETFPLPVL